MRVINKHKCTPEEAKVAKYIGRPSVLQNPFKISATCTRDQSCALFRKYFLTEIANRNSLILGELNKLQYDDLLMCFCDPEACHGHTVKEIGEFFLSHGGVYKALDVFDWTYGPEINMEPVVLTEMKTLLKLDHPDYVSAMSEDKRIELYKKHITRQLMSRDHETENAFRSLLGSGELIGGQLRNAMTLESADQRKLVTLTALADEFRATDSEYEHAFRVFRERHNHEKIDFEPSGDGETHINIYSKGKTHLGRMLSNFGHTPFKHPVHGYFSSVEAFWYWLSLGGKDDNLRTLHGFQAKKTGQAVRDAILKNGNKVPHVEDFKAMIKSAILAKIEQNPDLAAMLKNSTLPLTHYYVWGDAENFKISYPEKYTWIHEYISDVRDYLNGKAHKLIIAGSRDITDLDMIHAEYKELGLKVIEIVSGMARGPDKLGLEIAKLEELPVKKMPADWDAEPRSAGYIRNDAMAQYGTFALLFWDGVSRGTKHMQECCSKHEIQSKTIVVRKGKT